MIFFTSDTHYGHKNIVRGTTEWRSDGGEATRNTRDFNTLEEHNAAIVAGINSVVGKNDTLFCLGDWSFGGIQNVWNLRKQIKCKNIHLIYGNHDEKIQADKAYTIPEEDTKIYEELFQTRMGSTESQRTIPLRTLFNSVAYYGEIHVEHQMIVLSHYAFRVWNKSHKGAWMLYGHSHGTLDQLRPKFTDATWIGDDYYIKNSKSMDVGVDTNKYVPYSFTDLVKIMSEKEILLNIDHHGKHTN